MQEASASVSKRDSRLAFLQGFLKRPQQVGSIIPSSRFMERRIVQNAEIVKAKTVVELGSGTGGTTKAILNTLPPDGKLLGIEKHPDYLPYLRSIQEHRLFIFEDDALNLAQGLRMHKLSEPDVVISGIPFSTIGRKQGLKIIRAVWESLKPGGFFVAYQFRDFVCKIGSEVFGLPYKELEILNIPPMRVYKWQKVV